jgi:L-threonylcarbamoyladenylate synthase
MEPVSARYDCTDAAQREAGLAEAVTAVQQGGLVVLPTDTVYGIGADAFTPSAVSALLAAKGHGRNSPPPVLVGSVRAAAALTESLGAFGQDLIDEFWPGGLTLVFRSTPTLKWDLGDTMGTVAVRMPLHPLALELLRRTGPLAVTGANLHGMPAATSSSEAESQLGSAVCVYLDGGPCADNIRSTILDLTGTVPRMLRAGAVHVDDIRKVVPVIDLPAPPPEASSDASDVSESISESVPGTTDLSAPKPAEPHPMADGDAGPGS